MPCGPGSAGARSSGYQCPVMPVYTRAARFVVPLAWVPHTQAGALAVFGPCGGTPPMASPRGEPRPAPLCSTDQVGPSPEVTSPGGAHTPRDVAPPSGDDGPPAEDPRPQRASSCSQAQAATAGVNQLLEWTPRSTMETLAGSGYDAPPWHDLSTTPSPCPFGWTMATRKCGLVEVWDQSWAVPKCAVEWIPRSQPFAAARRSSAHRVDGRRCLLTFIVRTGVSTKGWIVRDCAGRPPRGRGRTLLRTCPSQVATRPRTQPGPHGLRLTRLAG